MTIKERVFDAIEEGILTDELIVECAIKYMSSADIEDMLHANEITL